MPRQFSGMIYEFTFYLASHGGAQEPLFAPLILRFNSIEEAQAIAIRMAERVDVPAGCFVIKPESGIAQRWSKIDGEWAHLPE